ncbi:ABC transporter substrate-binding protein [Thermococcus sp.]|uniref:ABC transporter substrate-binding protein n=1 Tax=Thermococcus sp. TaxID=35749 RepID=UPI002605813B|nr:ABC transporter substrate-binding protein [Thermococcus sp.]
MRRILGLLLAVLIVSSLGGFAGYAQAEELPRNETLYVGGGLWSPPTNFNPLNPSPVTGTVGLLYETLFTYDPLKDQLKPWLAEEGKWINDNTYEVKLREDLKWQDGKPLTAEDVKFTFEIARKHKGVFFSNIWSWLKEVKVVDDRTVDFVFSDPHYTEWNYWLYMIPIIPKHIWEKIDNPVDYANNENPVGSGMYKLYKTDQMRCIWVRNDNWWGIKYFGKPAPKYIVYVIVYSNNVALTMLVKGDLDWSNFFIPGVPDVKSKYKIVTWYDKPPYHLSANLALLFLNDNKTPFNNPDFRRAIAYAINPKEIAQRASQNQVLPADPSGLLPLPSHQKIKAEDLIKKYGWSYDPEKANEILDKLGYKDVNGDGFREYPDGKPMRFTIIVPYGWTDWMEMARIISDQLAAVGIRVDPKFPDFGKYWDDITKGTFDMAINNFGSFISITPWTFYNWILDPNVAPTGEPTYGGNWGRYKNPEVAELLTEIARTKTLEEAKPLYRKLQEIWLKEVPYIPLIYNGAWYEASPAHWTNWPSEKNPYAYPITWHNYWQLGGALVLLKIKPVTAGGGATTPAKTTESAKGSTTPSPTSKDKGLCGPAALVALSLVPIVLYRRRR